MDSNILQTNMDKLLETNEKSRFAFLSNTFELLFRCLLYFLTYRQAVESKLAKYQYKLEQVEREGLGQSMTNMKTEEITAKIDNFKKKLDDITDHKNAKSTFNLIRLLQQRMFDLIPNQKYTQELNQVIGQVTDIARILILSGSEQKKREEDQRAAKELFLPAVN
jgi:hypothetical protein